MDTKTFLIIFEKNMCEFGFSKEAARAHTLKIAKGLTSYDRERIEKTKSSEEVARIASGYSKRVIQKMRDSERATQQKAHTSASQNKNITQQNAKIDPEATKSFAAVQKSSDPADADVKIYNRPAASTGIVSSSFKSALAHEPTEQKTRTTKITVEINPARIDEMSSTKKIDSVRDMSTVKVPLTPRGKVLYRKKILSMLPVMILASIGAAAIILLTYSLIATVIAFFIILLAVITVAGSVCFLAGFIYGVVKLFSVLPEGVYEIGLAIVILGMTLALSICSYNIAVRFVPSLWSKFTLCIKSQASRLAAYKNKIRTECNEQ